MDYQPTQYQVLTEEQLRALPEEQIYGICLSLLESCEHKINAMIENTQSTLAYCDALDKAAELARSSRKTIDVKVEVIS